MDIVKLNWSGGKDSTASFLLHRDKWDKLKVVYYIPMLTDDIPLIPKKQYSFIEWFIERYRGEADFIRALGINYLDFCHTVKTRGINKGKMRGVCLGFGFCGFRNYSKLKALNTVDVGNFDYSDIGIAYDETRRLSQLDGIKKRSILVEMHITEKQAYQICKERGCLSPVYTGAFRDGCAICPNAKDERLKEWARDYPQGKKILIEIENEFCGPRDKIYRDGSKWSDHMD